MTGHDLPKGTGGSGGIQPPTRKKSKGREAVLVTVVFTVALVLAALLLGFVWPLLVTVVDYWQRVLS